VTQLFRASLARIQVEARDIARGAAANRENYYRFDFGADICNNTYLFNSEGFQNINVVGYWTIFGICAVIVLLAVPSDDKKLWPEILVDHHFIKVLGIVWIFIVGVNGYLIEVCRWLAKPFRRDGFLYNLAQESSGCLEDWAFWRRAP
jgi:hypothetical protein